MTGKSLVNSEVKEVTVFCIKMKVSNYPTKPFSNYFTRFINLLTLIKTVKCYVR